jgi:hypothetical protein
MAMRRINWRSSTEWADALDLAKQRRRRPVPADQCPDARRPEHCASQTAGKAAPASTRVAASKRLVYAALLAQRVRAEEILHFDLIAEV